MGGGAIFAIMKMIANTRALVRCAFISCAFLLPAALPHRMTDPAYLVLVAAYILFYISVARRPMGKTLMAMGGVK